MPSCKYPGSSKTLLPGLGCPPCCIPCLAMGWFWEVAGGRPWAGTGPLQLPTLLRVARARSTEEIIESYIRIDNRWKGGWIIGKDKWLGPNITATLILFKDSKLEGALRFLSPNYFR